MCACPESEAPTPFLITLLSGGGCPRPGPNAGTPNTDPDPDPDRGIEADFGVVSSVDYEAVDELSVAEAATAHEHVVERQWDHLR